MGLFMSVIDAMKPALKYALKSQKRAGSKELPGRKVEIPTSLWNMKESDTDEKTKVLARAISKLLISNELGGDENIFQTISLGSPIKGRIIRSYVAAMAMKRDESSVRRLFTQMLLDVKIEGEVQDHVDKIISLLGDKPAEIKERLKEAATETFVSLDDEDFEHMISSIV